MPTDFARKLLAAYRGSPEETVEFWDDLDFAESERANYYPPTENLTSGKSKMLGHCGRHTLPTDPDQELDSDPWEGS
jgi:hypothetical protein